MGKTLIQHNQREIAYFNNDDAQVSHVPNPGCKFILQHEESAGMYCNIDHIFIIHIDQQENEIERWDAFSPSVSFIKWK